MHGKKPESAKGVTLARQSGRLRRRLRQPRRGLLVFPISKRLLIESTTSIDCYTFSVSKRLLTENTNTFSISKRLLTESTNTVSQRRAPGRRRARRAPMSGLPWGG
jgi:hypothetical protein